jgi:hypothetical protein
LTHPGRGNLLASLRGENKRRFQNRSGSATISANQTQYGPGASIFKSFTMLNQKRTLILLRVILAAIFVLAFFALLKIIG